jgi:hypothetical protein
LAFAAHEGVQLNVSVLKDTLVFPEPTVIQASPTFDGENVLGATVTGTVFRPSGPAVPVTLFDDGLASHGDTTADDGVYSASFNAYDGDGTYTFEVAAENSTGTTFGGESLFSSAPSNSRSVSPFVRRASATAVVTGVPAVVSPPTNLDLLATSDTGRFDDDNFTGDDTPTIRAEADPGLTVQFQVDGTTAASGAEVSPGIYEATLPATSLTLGENVITATAGASAPSQPLTFQLAELRRVVLRGSNPELVYAQPDGPQVTLRVAAARAEIDLLATDNVAEMVTTTVRGTGLRTTGPQSSYVVRGTAGVAYVPEIEISSQSFARISLFDVLLGDLSAPGDLTQLSVRGTESELAGSVQIGANLNSIRAAEATLTGEIHVGRNLGSSEFASAADGSRIDVGWTISRVRFVQDSTIDLHARIIDRLFADATLEGNIEAALRIATIDLAGESDLTVTSRRIGTIRSGGELGGSYTASVIDQMISDGPITAAFIGRPRIRIGKSRPATSDV